MGTRADGAVGTTNVAVEGSLVDTVEGGGRG